MLAADVVHRVNAGGPVIAASPAFTSDAPFIVAGGDDSPGFSNPIDISGLALPEGTNASQLEALFQTERFDFNENISYEFPVTPGQYEVRLYFAETFSGAATVGGRVFDIFIENQLVANDFDVFVAAGNQGNRGVIETFTVTSDSSLDIDLLRGFENPAISAIEIISLDDMPGTLGTSTASLDFGQVVVSGPAATEQFVLTNQGGPSDASITIDTSSVSVNDAEFGFAFAQSGTITLAPGQSTTVNVTYDPSGVGTDTATLSIPHSGDNSPLTISLSGEGVNDIPVAFDLTTVQGAGAVASGTTLAFGPDGRLYVGQAFGTIVALEIERSDDGVFSVVSQETISVINDIVNHDDDGSVNTSVNTRIIGGIVVAGTAADPILYVSSSDPRTNENASIDTNSGIISRVTRNASGQYERLDLVRGIPRSARDHINGGLQLLDENTLLHSVGSFTNRGAPSGPFGDAPEVALSAAILEIDLAAIGDTTFDLPTLDDPSRPNLQDQFGNDILDQFGTPIDVNDVFGGNNGANQARLFPGSPVQIFASGLRNSFDLVVTQDGEVFATDNGPNSGFGNNVDFSGGFPSSFSTNGSSGPTRPDQLHFITEPGRNFFGHTNPTRASSQNLFNGQSPVAGTLNGTPFDLSDPNEIPFVEPGTPADGAITTFNESTNGITEFTAGNFGGALQGNILTVGFNGSSVDVTSVDFDPVTGATDVEVLATLPGGQLDITVAPDDSPLSGSIFVVNLFNGTITVLDPLDGVGGGAGTPDDLDGDGFTNDDEAANGTDPNNPASTPQDTDGDFVSDLLDDNDDNDARLDVNDPFSIDPLDGADTVVGSFFSFDNFVESPGGLFELGFTGTQTNGVITLLEAIDEEQITAIGAAGVFTVDSALAGTARGSSNDQLQALQFGVNVAQETEPFTATTELLGAFGDLNVVQAGQEQGLYIGTGDQDNYVSVILTGDAGGSIQVIREVDGVATVESSQSFAVASGLDVELFLTVDPLASTVQASFRIDGQTSPTLVGGPVSIPAEWLTDAALAVGVTSSNPLNTDQTAGGSEDFSVTYNYIGVVRDIEDEGAEATISVNAGGNIVSSSTFADGSFVIENTSSNAQVIESISIDLSTAILPDLLFDANGGAGDPVGLGFNVNSDGGTGAVGSFSGARDGGFEVLDISFNGFDVGEVLTFSTDIDPTTIQGVGGFAPGNPGEISGFELSGATVTVSYNDGTTTVSQLSPTPGTAIESSVVTRNGALAAPGLQLLGIGGQPNVVGPNEQTVRITAPEGATVYLQQIEAALQTDTVPNGGFDLDQFEANNVLSVDEQTFVIGAAGFVDVPVTLLRTADNGGLNYFLATVEDVTGRRSDLSQVLVEALPEAGAGSPVEVFNINFRSDGGPNANAGLNGTAFATNVTPAAFDGTTFNDTALNSQFVAATNASLQNLTNSTGQGSAVDVTITPNSGVFDFSSTGTSIELIQNYFTINNGFGGSAGDPPPATITFDSLGANSIWDIYFISQGDQIGQGGTFTIGDETRTSIGSLPTGGSFVDGQNFVVFTEVTADASGEITALFDNFGGTGGGPNPNGTGFGVLNGIQLVRREVAADDLLPGDFDRSGVVDLLDFNVFGNSFGSTTNLAADGNSSQLVNAADFTIFRDSLGASTASSVLASTAPPAAEPPALVAAPEAAQVSTAFILDAAAVAPASVTVAPSSALDVLDGQSVDDADELLIAIAADQVRAESDRAEGQGLDSEGGSQEEDSQDRDEVFADLELAIGL